MVTGAHFTPALAVIEELKKNYHAEIVYVGRKTTLEGDETPSVESQILPKLGVKFVSIIAGRLQRTFTIYTIPSLLKIPIGFLQALFIILGEKPDVILSFGGYVAVPIVFVGWLFSIPIIIHEQTLVSGLANKVSSILADKIALSFPSKRISKEKTILTGNPIRKEIIAVKPCRHKGINILITGGNQGSHVINLAVEQSLNKLTKLASIIHVTGDNRFHDFERLEKFTSESYMVKKWIGKQWGSILKKVDLVVSRAGINTLTELAYLGIPALVIPLPYLYQDEQNKNALLFEKLGLVKILPQSTLSADILFKNVKIMLNDLNHLTAKAKLARRVVCSDAAKRLALETVLLVKNSKN
ncbi:MAG: UDP-N-acetylglucosamine--N-acetylmuramyl-(pentapeptide) pyrophosphoryl-undecaprenol N-acetylglucosamine transferase [Nanoarchaeota archaeon]